MGRYYRIIHEPFLSEWLVRNYPIGTWRINVRVGPISPELLELTVRPELRRMMKITTGSVDAIVFLEDRVVLIEAMIRDEPGKIQLLKIYRDLFLSDPDFKEHWAKKIELVLLTPIWNPFIRAQCHREGVTYTYYRPPWIEKYLTSLPARFRAGRMHGVPIE